jgi:hypothetical protein
MDQFVEAEANLLEAYPILNKGRGEKHKETRDCAQAIADLYAAWDKAEPGKGHAKAAEWVERAKAAPAEDAKSVEKR